MRRAGRAPDGGSDRQRLSLSYGGGMLGSVECRVLQSCSPKTKLIGQAQTHKHFSRTHV